MPTGVYPRRKKFDYGSLVNPEPRKNRAIRQKVSIGGKQIAVSRLIMEQHLGRKLTSSEIVHHRNENPSDNHIENLEIVTRSEHKKIHDSIGICTRLKKIHVLDQGEIMGLRGRGLSFERIARLKGCNEITVRRFVRKIEKEKT